MILSRYTMNQAELEELEATKLDDRPAIWCMFAEKNEATVVQLSHEEPMLFDIKSKLESRKVVVSLS